VATPHIQQFLNDPDQPGRRAELSTFFGPHPEGFLAVYDRMFALAHRPPAQRRRLSDSISPWVGNGFCAPAFFLGFVWFYYRRMWAWATAFVVVMILLEWVPGTSRLGLVLAIGMALVARRLYVGHAIRNISRLRALAPPGQEPARFLLQLHGAGGVSRAAGWISGILFILVTVVTVLRTL
jgi:hypothetical protein